MDRILPIGPSLGRLLRRLLLSAVLLTASASAQFNFVRTEAAGTVYIQTKVFVHKPEGSSIQYQIDGGTWNFLPYSNAQQVASYQQSKNYTGLVNSTPIELQMDSQSHSIAFRKNNVAIGGGAIDIKGHNITITRTTNGSQTVSMIEAPPIIITIDAEGNVMMPEDEEEPDYVPGVLLLDNQTGNDVDVQIGDEKVRLKPGMNTVPFFGAVGPDGLPLALPSGMEPTLVKGPDGNSYWGASLVPGVEGGTKWQGMNGLSISPPPNSSSGPIASVPNGNGGSTQYQLPQGMTPGNMVPIPNGVTPGSPGLPNGVTPAGGNSANPGVPNGTNGSLPNGVVSGGSNFLPNGVSPGVVPNPAGSTGGSGGTGVTPGNNGGGVVVTPNDQGTATDGIWTGPEEVKPGNEHDVKGKLESLRGSINDKLAELFETQTGSSAISRLSVLSVDINLGALGAIQGSLNFGSTPFPEIRAAILVFFWGMLFVAFLRKITI